MEKNEKTSFDVFKDLSCRLPYGVVCNVRDDNMSKDYMLDGLESNGCIFKETEGFYGWNSFEIRPYLRPMSSMTEEEKNELESITFPLMEKDWDGNENPACIRWIDIPKYMDFILSHHFDYQGLIEKGLAIEATEENNQE